MSFIDVEITPIPQEDKLSNVNRNLEEIRNQARDNIRQSLNNIHEMSDLEAQSDNLAEEANKFRNNTRTLKYKFCSRSYKYACVIFLIIVILLLIIILPIVT